MKSSIELSAPSCQLREIVTSARTKGTLAWKDGFELLAIAHETVGIENAPDVYCATSQELAFGMTALQRELADHVRRSASDQPICMAESTGARSLRLARIAMDAEVEAYSAGLDLVIRRDKGVLLIGDLIEHGRPWLEVSVCHDDPDAVRKRVRAFRETWDE